MSSPEPPSDPPPCFQRAHRVRWNEVDASERVHFSNYFRYLEETEYAYLRSRGLSVVWSDRRGTLGFPRISSQVDVESPAQIDEVLLIDIVRVDCDGKTLNYTFQIRCGRRLVCRGAFVVACCRFPTSGDPYAIPIPETIMNQLSISPIT